MSRSRRIARAGGIFACSVLALLLWSKLKLVSGIPRTAYAVPEKPPADPALPPPDPDRQPEAPVDSQPKH
jgi:hypothetical protein